MLISIINPRDKSRGNNYKYQYHEYIPYQMFILVHFNKQLLVKKKHSW